jgi:hypothetical protein
MQTAFHERLRAGRAREDQSSLEEEGEGEEKRK